MRVTNLYIGKEINERLAFSESDVNDFCVLSGDNNPIHMDEHYAHETRFGERIVHGILAVSVFSKIIGTKMPGIGSIYLEQTVRFVRPIYIDQKINAIVKIIDIIEEKNIIVLETDIMNEEKTEYLVKGTAKVLIDN